MCIFFSATYFSNKINPDLMACGITNMNYEGICIISLHPNPLGISAKLQKATISFMISLCPSIHPSAHLHGITWFRLDIFA